MKQTISFFNMKHLLENGFSDPVYLLNKNEISSIAKHIKTAPRPMDWIKGQAVTSRKLYQLSSRSEIVNTISKILGDNFILWGASIVTKKPGETHQWHSDIETHDKYGKSVSVWIALKNSDIKSSVKFVSHSHLFNTSVQEEAFKRKVKKSELNDKDIYQWAKGYNKNSKIVQHDIRDGMAIFFDGAIWHGSVNRNKDFSRTAILLQYISSDIPVRIYNPHKLEWPFEYLQNPKPPCLAIRGKPDSTINRIVEPPESETKKRRIINRFTINSRPVLTSHIKKLEFPLEENKSTGWEPYNILSSSTSCIDLMNIHISVLSPGIIPHPPHKHREEEILIMLSGEADAIIKGYNDQKEETRRLKTNSLIYYPRNYIHTINNSSDKPATYLMFKWHNPFCIPLFTKQNHRIVDFSSTATGEYKGPGRQFRATKLFEYPTRYLRKLHCHLTTIEKGGGYKPHSDPYDVAIIILSGKLETLGTIVNPHGLIYYSAGIDHGIKNIGETPACYLVFEFHKKNIFHTNFIRKKVGKISKVVKL